MGICFDIHIWDADDSVAVCKAAETKGDISFANLCFRLICLSTAFFVLLYLPVCFNPVFQTCTLLTIADEIIRLSKDSYLSGSLGLAHNSKWQIARHSDGRSSSRVYSARRSICVNFVRSGDNALRHSVIVCV